MANAQGLGFEVVIEPRVSIMDESGFVPDERYDLRNVGCAMVASFAETTTIELAAIIALPARDQGAAVCTRSVTSLEASESRDNPQAGNRTAFAIRSRSPVTVLREVVDARRFAHHLANATADAVGRPRHRGTLASNACSRILCTNVRADRRNVVDARGLELIVWYTSCPRRPSATSPTFGALFVDEVRDDDHPLSRSEPVNDFETVAIAIY